MSNYEDMKKSLEWALEQFGNITENEKNKQKVEELKERLKNLEEPQEKNNSQKDNDLTKG